MAALEGKSPAERNKMIAAIVLGSVALLSLGYMFFGSNPAPKRTTTNANTQTTTTTTQTTVQTTGMPRPEDVRNNPLSPPEPVVYTPAVAGAPEAGRNIFAYYVKPTPTPTPQNAETISTPTPTPTPPVLLASVQPQQVFARTGDFTLTVTGDKFTPATHIFIGDTEVPTKFVSPQQLTADVPGALISFEGSRQIVVKTTDGQLYSNPLALNVQQPPPPNFMFVGIIGKVHHNDIAVLKEKNGTELLNVQLGDIIGGHYRVISISEREVIVTDTNLRNVKHKLPFTGDNSRTPQQGRPVVRGNEDEDPDDPQY
ncbi:MAG TPA: IPT/TIG domain-containing protein [Pyrinomonadaceae bacterium]|nr:IPT/TIG domain-containing protein [Pyrinomonadaceae bacterium]